MYRSGTYPRYFVSEGTTENRTHNTGYAEHGSDGGNIDGPFAKGDRETDDCHRAGE